MATIRNAIQLQDGMSPVIRSMTSALNICISSFESMQTASGNAIDTSSLQAARRELNNVELAVDQMELSIRNANNQQQQFNNSLHQGEDRAEGLAGKVGDMVKAYLGFEAAKKGIEGTIGGAMKMQQQLFTIQGIMGDKEVATAYFNHINDMANKSVYSLEDFAGSARKFMQFTKNTDSLDKLLKLNERLALVDPMQGFEGAGFALKEMMSGDGTSLKERFGFGKADIEILKASKDMNSFITQFDTLLSKKGFTEQMLEQYNKSAAAQFDNLKSNIETSFAQAGNGALEKLAPVFDNLNQAFNNGSFQGFFDGLSNGLAMATNLIITLGSWVQTIGAFFQSNWGIIEPVLLGIIGALIVYNATMGIAWLTTIKNVAAKAADAIASFMDTAAIIAMTIAQEGLNAALAMCPLTWIIILIIILIALFYGAVAAVNKFAGTSYSATGLIAGAFMALAATIYNAIAFVWNVNAAFAEFLINVFTNPTEAVKRLFLNLALAIIDAMLGATRGCDQFATNFANAIISGINMVIGAWNDFVDLLNGAGIADKMGLGKGTEFKYTASITSDLDNAKSMIQNYLNTTPDNYTKVPRMESKDIGAAAQWGYEKGAGFASSIENMFATPSMNDLANNVKLPESNGVNDLLTNTGDTAKNTGAMKDKMDITDEDIKYLRDIAEQEVINRFTTAEIKVDMVNHNNVSSDMDIDGIIHHLGSGLYENLQTVAEGATYDV